MAVRRPIVNVSGVKSELPVGDTLPGGLASGYIEFTTSQTWTVPGGATWLWVEVVGAGASGAANTASNSSSGGSGGQCVRTLLRAQDVPASVSVVVGAGGAPVSGSVVGNDGGDSAFGDVSAYGGRGGMRANGQTLPKTYATLSSVALVDGLHDAGASAYTAETRTTYGGGGGGGYSVTGIRGVSKFHGDGGLGRWDNADGHSDDGEFPGGGGGGRGYATSALRMSGAGAAGVVRVWWW